jgi:hypothetical protein
MPTIAYVRPPESPSGSASVLDAADVDHENADLAVLAARNAARMTLVDLRAHVCPRGRFQEGLDGVDQLRPDGVHYGPAGSDLVGRWLAPLLVAARSSAR